MVRSLPFIPRKNIKQAPKPPRCRLKIGDFLFTIVQKLAEKIKIPKKPLTLREYYYIIYLYCYALRMSWRRDMTYNIYTSVCKLGVLRTPMYNKFSYAAKAVYYVFSKK